MVRNILIMFETKYTNYPKLYKFCKLNVSASFDESHFPSSFSPLFFQKEKFPQLFKISSISRVNFISCYFE